MKTKETDWSYLDEARF